MDEDYKYFSIEATLQGGAATWQTKQQDLPVVPVAVPKEFNGPGGGYSPEDLFAMACTNCIIATFKVYIELAKVTFSKLQANTKLVVGKHPEEQYLAMLELEISIHITGASDKILVKKNLEQAVRNCAVCNSVKAKKIVRVTID